MVFKERLKEKRTEANLTQVELAEKAGVTARTIQNYELGSRKPSNMVTIQKIADALNTTTEYLLGSSGTYVVEDPEYLLSRPWTIFTYMFTQFDFLHLLFNMLWLYWFGSFFLNYFTERKLTGVYLLGGLFGGLLYIAAYNIFPYFRPHISEDFVKLDQALLECNAMTRVKFADADSLLCDAGQIFKVVRHILSPAPECIVTSPIEKSQWQDFTD